MKNKKPLNMNPPPSKRTKRQFKPFRSPVLTKQQTMVMRKIAKQAIVRAEETKFSDLEFSANVGTGGSLFTNLNSIAAGDRSFERTGIIIKPQYLKINARIVSNSLGNDSQTVRVIVYQWNSSSTPPLGAPLQDNTASLKYLQNYNMNAYRGLYRIIYDEMFTLSLQGQQGLTFSRSFNISKLKNLGYSGPLGTDLLENGLFVYVVGDQTANFPTIDGVARLGFKE